MAAKNFIERWWDRRSPDERTLIFITGAVTVYFVLNKISQAIFSSDQSGGNSQNIGCGTNTTLTLNEFTVLADAIEAAIWGVNILDMFTEDDEAIGAILMAMQTTDDVCMLAKKYGVRKVGVLLSEGGNLAQSIQAYLDNDIKKQVNEYYQSKGIDWIWA